MEYALLLDAKLYWPILEHDAPRYSERHFTPLNLTKDNLLVYKDREKAVFKQDEYLRHVLNQG